MSVNRKLVYIYCKFMATGIVKVYLRDSNWGDIFYIYKLKNKSSTFCCTFLRAFSFLCHKERKSICDGDYNLSLWNNQQQLWIKDWFKICCFLSFRSYFYNTSIWLKDAFTQNKSYKWFSCVVKHKLWQKYFVCQSYMVCICID